MNWALKMNHMSHNSYSHTNCVAAPCLGLTSSVIGHDDLAHSIHWRFGLSEKNAQNLANDIYRIIEN